MNYTKPLSILAIALLLVSSLSGIALAVEFTQIDTNHPLTSESKISNYQKTGKVTGELAYPRMTITIAETKTQAGLDSNFASSITDANNAYLRIDYNEDKPRVVRFYIPNEYFKPYSDTIKPIKGGEILEIKPVRDRNYTSVKVRLNANQTTYIYRIDKTQGWVDSKNHQISETREWFIESANPFDNNTSEPQPKPSEVEWQYVDSENINGSVKISVGNISEGYQVQYYTGVEWQSVPEHEQQTEPYYIQTRQGVNDTIWVISTQNETPQIRYKTSENWKGTVKSTGEGLGTIVNKILQDITGFL